MSQDRELLEKAAKAVGMPYEWLPMLGGMYQVIDAGRMNGPWNPLTDDGDALRLAVKLNMRIEADEIEKRVSVAATTAGLTVEEFVDWDGDPYAATRRAIVRAAAVIAEGQS
jgi:hypothetical protein